VAARACRSTVPAPASFASTPSSSRQSLRDGLRIKIYKDLLVFAGENFHVKPNRQNPEAVYDVLIPISIIITAVWLLATDQYLFSNMAKPVFRLFHFGFTQQQRFDLASSQHSLCAPLTFQAMHYRNRR